MMAKIFDGEQEAAKRELALAAKVKALGKKLKLVSVVVGDNPASHLYVRLKGEAAKRVGIGFVKEEIQSSNGKFQIDEIKDKIDGYGNDKIVTGVMVQLPLPGELRDKTAEVLGAIKLSKDVDGLRDNSKFLPATAKAVMSILEKVVPEGVKDKKIVVVGRSNIVGKPVAKELRKLGAEVTVGHSKTADLGVETRKAEILISAVGRTGLIQKDMVKPGAIVIDVGEPKADVAYDVRSVASVVTPVPGGVGPMTVISLLENVVASA